MQPLPSRRFWLAACLAVTCTPPARLHLCTARSEGGSGTAGALRLSPAEEFRARAMPKAPPPVAPPPGQGNTVPLQRYIVVDQFGYRPRMTKVAVLADPVRGFNAGDAYQPGPELEVRRWADGATVWHGAPEPWNHGAIDEASGDRGAWLDFSALETPGLYYVFDPTTKRRSYPFAIDDDVYLPVLKSALHAYYFNRANVEKKPPFSCVGKRCWSLGADYVGPGQDREARSVRARDDPKTARDLHGGWWDAGDTDKYVTFTCDPVHQLLSAYEERPRAFDDASGLPESGNGIPDVLDEVLVELRWLERMQPPDLDGGALLKLGVVEDAQPIPDRSRLPRYYYPEPCSSATIVVAGEFAHAARVLRDFPALSGVADELARRARAAWLYFQHHPKSDACDDGTIKAGDADRPLAHQEEDAVIAAVHLFALTGEREYGDFVVGHFRATRPFQEDRWGVYDPAEADALLAYARLSNADVPTRDAILERLRSELGNDVFGFDPRRDLYRAYMRKDSYHWGSNNQRASFGNTNYDVVLAGLAPGDERATYVERAAGMLHSFHGVNPMGLVYLTNMYALGGDACADEMFHAWFRDGDPKWDNARTSELGPAPGYVTGGPNAHYCEGQDPTKYACAKSLIRTQPPGKAYVDTNAGWDPSNPYDRSWELTEPGIYYQASYVRLVSKFVK